MEVESAQANPVKESDVFERLSTGDKRKARTEVAESSKGKKPKTPTKPRGLAKGALERHTSPLDEIFSRASIYPSDFCTRNNYEWCNDLQKSLFEHVARDLGDSPLLIPPEKEDRIFDLTKGFGIYTRMIDCGFKLPMTAFQRELLEALKISPCQLHSNAWWMLTSVEHWFKENHEALGTDRPTIHVIFKFFKFAKNDSDWVSMKANPKEPKLFSSSIGKIPEFSRPNRWNHRYMFLLNPDTLPEIQGVPKDWKPLPTGTFPSPPCQGDFELCEKVKTLIKRKGPVLSTLQLT
jgi:hypothetical protein